LSERQKLLGQLDQAKMASWSGVRVQIAAASRPAVLAGAVAAEPGVGTVVLPRDRPLPARKLWIAFAVAASGTVQVDDGARDALVTRGTSLLPAGVVDVEGQFDAENAVEVGDTSGRIFAKGLVRMSAADIRAWAGRRTTDLPEGLPHEVIHRDDLVVTLP
jgi:glutamate 5-kinase